MSNNCYCESNVHAKMVFTLEYKIFIIESYFRNCVFNNGEWTLRYCLFDRVWAKMLKFKFRYIYATKNTSVHLEHLV
jgi:hypothetical protein